MEQDSFTPQTSGLYILDGQAFFIKNGLESSNSSGNSAKCDIVQQALHGLTLANTDTDQPEINFNGNSSISKQNYVLLDQGESDEGPVVQLSISDDYPLQFRNASEDDKKNNETLGSGSQKNNLSSNKLDNSLTDDLLSSLLTPKDNLGRQFELVSPLKQNCTYAYKLTNGAELCPVIRTEARTNTVNVPGITSKPRVDCRVSNSVIAPLQGAISKVTPMQNGRKLIYVNKILKGVSVKPGLMLNMKSKTTQEQLKGKPQTVQLVTPNGKPLHINNLKTGSTLKKKASPVVQFMQQAEIGNTPKFSICSDMKTISYGKPILLNTLLKTKPVEIRPKNDNNLNMSEPSLLQNNGPPQRSFLLQHLQKENKSQINSVPRAEKEDQPVTKSIGKLTQSQLKKIAAVFRNSCVNGTMLTNTAAFDSETNTRVVCRVVYPEDLIKGGEKPVVKQGKKRARSVEPDKVTAEDEKTAKKTPPPTARTRSGRLSRPPRYMVKDFKKLTEDAETSYSDYVSEENSENTPFLHFPDPQQRKSKFSTRFHCPTCNKVYLGNKKMLKHFSEYPDHNNGETIFNFNEDEIAKQQVNQRSMWKKIFRKGARSNKFDTAALFKELFHVCSKEHIAPVANEWVTTNVEPWDYLKTRQMKEGGGVKGLLSDLSSLINSIPKDLLLTAQPGDIGSIHIEDEGMCRMLNISPGHYLPNESSLKQDEIINVCTNNSSTNSNIESAENYWDTGDIICSDDKVELVSSKVEDVGDISKVDTSELNEMLLDKSSLESVDQIVNERLNDLILTSPLDVSPLVETQVLAHSILTSSPDLLHNVTGSTEDLLKTLDNLTPVLPSDSASNDFDFTVLSSDFASDR